MATTLIFPATVHHHRKSQILTSTSTNFLSIHFSASCNCSTSKTTSLHRSFLLPPRNSDSRRHRYRAMIPHPPESGPPPDDEQESNSVMLLRCSSTPIFQSPAPEEPSLIPKKKTRNPLPIAPKPVLVNKSALKKNVGDEGGKVLQTAVIGGDCGGNGGRLCIGGENRSDGGSDHGHNDTDLYYQKMMDTNPGNVLLLTNYAKFLIQVVGDHKKAEEYYERAILANPDDGNVLSLYAELIWEIHKDGNRAESYFTRAVETNPNDCYVLASYGRFLWETEDDDEEDELFTGSSHGFTLIEAT